MSRIGVAGGTGLTGRHVVDALRRSGHEAVVLSRASGVDLVTGAGLADALRGATAVIDVTNTRAADPDDARAFFGAVTRNLLAAEQQAGTGHHVMLSIAGVDRVEGNGHYAGKRRQEELVTAGPVPATIVRATQFHEFAAMVVNWTRSGDAAAVPPLLVQPVDPADVGDVLARTALDGPAGTFEVAGPDLQDLVDMARRTLTARGEALRLLPTWRGPFGPEMAGEMLLPGPDAMLAPTTFEQWLVTQRPQKPVRGLGPPGDRAGRRRGRDRKDPPDVRSIRSGGGSPVVCRVPRMTQPASEARALLDRWAARPARPVQQLTAEDVRRDDLAVLDVQRTPGDLYSVEDVEAPGPAGTLKIRLYRPHPGRLHPVLFLHGGGFVIGGEGYDAPLRELALASGCLIVSPECRLAPEHPYPAAVDDAEAAARWLNAEAPGLGADDTPAAMAGDSSGGNLAAAVTHALSREGTPPSFQLLIYPMLDATASSASYEEFAEGYGFSADKSRWYFDQYLPPGVDRHAPRVSPLFDEGLSGVPATLIVTAECDPLRDDGERYARVLREAGVAVELRRYRGMIHGFFQMTGALEGSRRLHRELGAWMRGPAVQVRRAT